ncbi:MAG: hypothetical protein R3F59_22990 [Myxococcota bacterium]
MGLTVVPGTAFGATGVADAAGSLSVAVLAVLALAAATRGLERRRWRRT